MGFDISYHPISSEQMKKWYFSQLDNAKSEKYSEMRAIGEAEQVDSFYVEKYIKTMKVAASSEPNETFEKTHAYYLAVVQGFFLPYYYTRGTGFSFLINQTPQIAQYTTSWNALKPDFITCPIADKLSENYSGGVYMAPNQVKQLLADYSDDDSIHSIIADFFEQNLPVFLKALQYAVDHELGLLEATEVVEPNPTDLSKTISYSNLMNCDKEGALLYRETALKQIEECLRANGDAQSPEAALNKATYNKTTTQSKENVTIKYFKEKASPAKMRAITTAVYIVRVLLVLLLQKYSWTFIIRYGINKNVPLALLIAIIALVVAMLLSDLICKLIPIFQPEKVEMGITDDGLKIGNVIVPYQSIKKAELSMDIALRNNAGAGLIHIIADDEYLFQSEYSGVFGKQSVKRKDVLKMNSFNRDLHKQLIRNGFYGKMKHDIATYQLIDKAALRHKKYRYSNTDVEMDSADYSILYDAWMCEGDLYLAVDSLIPPVTGKDTPCYVYDCLLVIRKAELLSETGNENLMTPERLQEMQQYAKKENKTLYIPFDVFLQNAAMDVQDFLYDPEHHTFEISGYPDNLRNPGYEWCALRFRYEKIECFWNETGDE